MKWAPRIFQHGCGNRTWRVLDEDEPDFCESCRIDAPWEELTLPWEPDASDYAKLADRLATRYEPDAGSAGG